MDPFNMPSFGSVNYNQELQSSINSLAPLATSYHGAQTGVNIQQYQPPTKAPTTSGLGKFANFFESIGKEVGHITGSVAKWVANQTVSAVEAPYKLGEGLSNAWLDHGDLNTINALSQQNSDKLLNLNKQYRAGIISSTDYKLGLKEINSQQNDLSNQILSLSNRIKSDQQQTDQALINTSADLLTVLTAGFGKAASTEITANGAIPKEVQSAGDFLMSNAAKPFFKDATAQINKIASQPEIFNALTKPMQDAVQKATVDIFAQGAERMTAAQIGRASVANLAVKYPIIYNYLSSTGTQLYKQLDNQKYGDAIRTIAFNSLLLLSGGPIGYAMKEVGGAIKGVSAVTFGRSSFIDELSKGIGNGTPSGLYEAINKLPANEKADVIKQMSAVESTNLGATGGDPVAAAWRVLHGMENYEGASMSTFSHEEALANMVNFAKAQRLADEAGKAAGIGAVTVGRVDARQLDIIGGKLGSIGSDLGAVGKNVGGDITSRRLQAWGQLKSENPTQAWANNTNFDKQIKYLISQHEDAGALDNAIRSIKASFAVDGFPKSVAKQLSKMGYIPITPSNIEAPFKEGAGKVASQFAQNNDFFIRTVKPLPVLGHLGDMLTGAGLSPQQSVQRVYEVFNQNVAENLSKVSVFSKLSENGLTDAQNADSIIKRLSNYAHTLDGRKLPIKAPITDLRQLTTKDVANALEISSSQAREVKQAISDSMIKVPLQIRGLGDKVMDYNYKFNPLSKPYARLQGALRFSWNPFFQVKLATKSEFLTQLEAGGKTPPIQGIASLFSKEYGDLNKIRGQLREAGIFEENAGRFIVGGEAVQDGSAIGANLTHRLLPVQEKSIAGLIATQAEKAGMDTESFIKAYPQQVRDTVYMIAQYDRRSNLLNSPLVRTLNFAFFPFRFDLKVAQITARALAKSDPIYQLAFIKGLYNTSNWLKSPEGQAWYSRNSEVIGLFAYFSPLATLSTISSVLGGESPVQAFELGGLPFGWIPQLLDAEGLTHFGQSYVNPKTGAVALDYVPVTARGQLQTAISDFLSSIFSYPGATVGLPSKGTITRYVATAITGGKSKSDFKTTTPAISLEQQSFQQTVQQLAGTAPGQATPVRSDLVPGIKVPPEPTPVTRPIPKPARTSGGPRKKKKAQFTPALLPGQSQLGRL